VRYKLSRNCLKTIRDAALAAAVCLLPCSMQAAPEVRALWVDAWHNGFLNTSQVSTVVNYCRTYNFNAVVVQMRRRGDAWYMPQAPNQEPRTTAISASYDALQDMINQCHTGTPRIQVHVWAPTFLIHSTQNTAPSQASHVYNLHPEYLMKNSSGATWIGEGYFIDPGHPGTGQWNYNMVMDVVSRYDVDGFHWDYVRYPQQDSGYNDTAIARYNAEFGLTGTPSSTDSQFTTWRQRQVTDFLRWTTSEILAIKPNIAISCSVFASRYDAYTYRFQDWAAWNNEGIIDLCFPMNYSTSNSTFNSRADDAAANQGIRWVIMGPGAYMNTKENTLTQLNYSRALGLKGSCLYSYAIPNSGTVDQAGTFTYIRDNYQSTYEAPPALPWKSAPTKGIIKGTVTVEGTGAAVYNAVVTLQSSPQRTQKTESHGKYAFFEVAPGTYGISATANGLGTATGSVTVTAGTVVNCNLVLPATDGTPPTISNVSSGNVTDSSARITWSTNEAASSVVEFGPTVSYGFTASDSSLVISHVMDLSGLTPSTPYHFRVKSSDAGGNQAVSGDYTFTTNDSGVVSDIIIDNPAATFTGSWSTGTSATDKYGADYKYKSQNAGAYYAQFTPNILTPGTYNVYEWHSQGGNRTAGSQHVVKYSGGQQTVSVNQQTGGGTWNLLGTYSFTIGTTGYVRITDGYVDGLLTMADAIKFEYVPPPGPATPSGLAATAVGSTQINLTWADNSSDELAFILARGTTSGGPYSTVATLGAGTTSYSDTGLAPDTTYYYVVRATNTIGSSSNSNQASAKTLVAAPAAPGGLTATAVSPTQINLSWADNSSNEINFVVGRAGLSGGPYTDIATLPAGTTSYSDTGLAASTPYHYVIRATNAGGASGNSNEAGTMTLPLPPAAPSNLLAVSVLPTQANLGWSDNSINEDGFRIQRKREGGSFTEIAVPAPDALAYTDNDVTSGVQYVYRICATNGGGDSPWSNEAGVMPPHDSTFAPDNSWAVMGTQSGTCSADHDTTLGALRLTIAPGSTPRIIGWQSPRIAYTNWGGNHVYRFKAYVFRSGQPDPGNINQVPNMRIRAAARFSMSSMLEVFYHLSTDPQVAGFMAPNAPSADPTSPTAYRVDFDPVDIPFFTSGANPAEGIHAIFEAYALEPQESGSIELAEGVLGTYMAPNDATGVLLQTYVPGVSDAGSFSGSAKSLKTLGGSLPLPIADDTTSLGAVLDSRSCATTDVAVAAMDFTVTGPLELWPRVEDGKLYRLKFHVMSEQNANRNCQVRMRARTIKFSWTQKYEVGGAFPTNSTESKSIAQQALPGNGTMNPDKLGTEVPGVLDGGWYCVYLNPPNVIPASQPGYGVDAPSVRDIRCGFDLLDTMSGGTNAPLEAGHFVLDRIEVMQLDQVPD
jgi:uncharacterized lipoprotein YddW (UPF0748 family)